VQQAARISISRPTLDHRRTITTSDEELRLPTGHVPSVRDRIREPGQSVTAADQDFARSPVAQLSEHRQPELALPAPSYLLELEVSPVRNSTTSPSAIT
jgi:hypothetical protein